MSLNDNTLKVDNAEIRWRNFAGEADTYNNEGSRNFCLFLDEDIALRLVNDNWPIKMLEPREEGEPRKYFVRVKVKMDGNRPPTVVMITHKGRTILDEETVSLLDHVFIKNVDCVVRLYNWHFGSKSGWNVYLNAIYITLEENEAEIELEERYAALPLVSLDGEDVEEPEPVF